MPASCVSMDGENKTFLNPSVTLSHIISVAIISKRFSDVISAAIISKRFYVDRETIRKQILNANVIFNFILLGVDLAWQM